MRCKVCGKEENPNNYVNSWKEQLLHHKMCHSCNFWRNRLEEDSNLPPHTAVMIDGTHYIIGPDDDYFRGFGGSKFQIKFNDGTRIVSTNLWCQGKPSPEWTAKFPNNAVFENNLKWKTINGINYLME